MHHKIRNYLISILMKTPLEPLARKLYQLLMPRKVTSYDTQTFKIMRMELGPKSNTVDIGAYRGEILKELIKISPEGKHFAFEPNPENYSYLVKKFGSQAKIFNCALSDKKGEAQFKIAVGRSARSGLKQVDYPDPNQEIREVKVELNRLDSLIKSKIDLIKIDVEGAEYSVLKGASGILEKYKPLVVFEHEIEKCEFYDTKPDDIFKLFTNVGMHISLLKDFINNKPSLSRMQFISHVNNKTETYFVAHR